MKSSNTIRARAGVLFAAWVGLWLSQGSLTSAETRGVTLGGVVAAEGGKALPGATVFIYTAAPKKGTSMLCPSCYADCVKKATTDSSGYFLIEALDPSLNFKVLFVAKGYHPMFLSKVDPTTGPIEAVLKIRPEQPWVDRMVRGRVRDAEGKPVAAAVVSIKGVTRANAGTQYGGNNEVDPLAVSDEQGEFVIYSTSPFEAVGLDVEARGLAKAVFQNLKAGTEIHELTLNQGASLKGRLMKDGKPLAGVQIGISGAERWSEVYIGNFTVGTDAEGRFLLVNVPAKTDYEFYGVMKSLKKNGSLASRRIRVEEVNSTLDLGDLKMGPAFKLEGRIKLADGKKVPAGTEVHLGREEAWDYQQQPVDSQGRFKFDGIPAEPVSVSVRVSGYTFSAHNRSLDVSNPFRLIGRLTSSKTNLVLELEPGKFAQGQGLDTSALRQEPLRGAEGGTDRVGELQVTGTVTDAETGKPLAAFTVTEGRHDQFLGTFNWLTPRKSAEKNGEFINSFTRQQQPPGVLIEADGYLPQASPAITGTNTHLTFAMKKGTGPSGIVKLPDGKEAGKVTVYLPDLRNGVYVDSRAGVREEVSRGLVKTEADASGKFKFAPRVDAFCAIVYDSAGYAMVRVEELEKNHEVRLQPWSRVEGVLMIGARPGTNESIHLTMANVTYEFHPRSFSPLNLYLETTTDSEGRFVFERVPPVNVGVYHSPKVRDSQSGTIAESQGMRFALKPGETRRVALGGKGRPVIGKFIVNGYSDKIDWRSDVYSLERVVDDPPGIPSFLTMSKEYGEAARSAKSDEEKAAARKEYETKREEMTKKISAFYQTEAGREHYFKHGRYALNFNPDGTFRIEDVPGGKYELRMTLREGGGDSPMRFSAPTIASLNKEIEIPVTEGRSDDPFDVGTIEMQARNNLKSGKSAPGFTVKTLEGKTIQLADFKGKYVLLDFWAVWCGPCVAETPNLKATYDAFKDDPRFAMIGLSLDPEEAAPRDYARKNELGWIHGFLGDWAKTQVPNQFGVEGIPSIFLIGPDGKIIQSGLRGPGIRAAVQSALGSPQAKK